MSAVTEYAQLFLFGGGAVIVLFILIRVAQFIFTQLIQLVLSLLRLMFRQVPQIIAQAITGFLASLLMALLTGFSGISVNELIARIIGWFSIHGIVYTTYITELAA